VQNEEKLFFKDLTCVLDRHAKLDESDVILKSFRIEVWMEVVLAGRQDDTVGVVSLQCV
jgi:hypothetical protein